MRRRAAGKCVALDGRCGAPRPRLRGEPKQAAVANAAPAAQRRVGGWEGRELEHARHVRWDRGWLHAIELERLAQRGAVARDDLGNADDCPRTPARRRLVLLVAPRRAQRRLVVEVVAELRLLEVIVAALAVPKAHDRADPLELLVRVRRVVRVRHRVEELRHAIVRAPALGRLPGDRQLLRGGLLENDLASPFLERSGGLRAVAEQQGEEEHLVRVGVGRARLEPFDGACSLALGLIHRVCHTRAMHDRCQPSRDQPWRAGLRARVGRLYLQRGPP